MTVERRRVQDTLVAESAYQRGDLDIVSALGTVEWALIDASGLVRQSGVTNNLVTQVGDQFLADRAVGILGATVNISSSTNASPIVITTATSHGFGVGDEVIVASHTTNTNANGTWNISAATANTITLQGTTGNGVGGATGTVQSFSVAAVSGMKLGTGTTAVAKTGAGAALVTYVTNSHQAIDATYPQSSLSGSSRRVTWRTTWAAGKATANNISEVVLVNETVLSDATNTAANTVARALLSPTINKGAGDSLVLTWHWDLLGS